MDILQLFLHAADLAELQRFYVGVLGLRQVEPLVPDGELALRAGNTTLVFRQSAPDFRGRYHFAFGVPGGMFEAARAWLAQRAKALSDSEGKMIFESQSWNTIGVYFLDPAGNILELIARKDAGADTSPALPFGSHAIQGICEIGVASDDVEGASAELIENAPGLQVYRPGEPDTFKPLGDDQGLFIMVRRGRIWFPNTGVPAELLPLEVVFVVNGLRCRLAAPPYPFLVNPT